MQYRGLTVGTPRKGVHPLSLGQKIGKLDAVIVKCPDCSQAAVIISEQVLVTPTRIIGPGQAMGQATSGTRYALCLWCGRREKLEMQANQQWKVVETHQGTPPEVKQ